MSIFLIASHTPGAGKTAVAAGLATLAGRSGTAVSLCKPLSPAGRADPDAAYFARHFASGDTAVGGPADAAALDTAAAGILAQADAAAHTLVELPNPAEGSGIASPLTTGLAQRLGARVIAIFDYAAGASAATITGAVAPLNGALDDALAATLLNRTPRYRTRDAGSLLAELAAAGIPASFAIPDDRPMLSLTMTQLAQGLGGRWELEPQDGDAWVDRFLIGGNIMDSGAGYFGRHSRQAVITRAERPDIQMASLMPNGHTRCLVLTGGARPAEYIRVEAAKHNVPVLLVDGGTTTTADAVGSLLPAATPHHTHKAARMADLLSQQLDLATLLP